MTRGNCCWRGWMSESFSRTQLGTGSRIHLDLLISRHEVLSIVVKPCFALQFNIVKSMILTCSGEPRQSDANCATVLGMRRNGDAHAVERKSSNPSGLYFILVIKSLKTYSHCLVCFLMTQITTLMRCVLFVMTLLPLARLVWSWFSDLGLWGSPGTKETTMKCFLASLGVTLMSMNRSCLFFIIIAASSRSTHLNKSMSDSGNSFFFQYSVGIWGQFQT